MNEVVLPIQTTRTLIKSLIAALLLAIAVFVTIVLPAEYNIDPTGIGAKLGLTVLATAVTETAPAVITTTDTATDATTREDLTTVTIPANNGVEYKFYLQQYGKLSYEWSSAANVLYFDLHGEPEGNTTGYFESYASANGSEMKGSLTAPFTGSHGWYWSNSSNADVVVTLKTQGEYAIIGLK